MTTVALMGLCKNLFPQNAVKFIPETLVQGREVGIVYDNKNTLLANSSEINGIIYFLENYKWMAYDLQMKKNDQVWTSSYTIPQNAALCLLTFNDGKLVDKGGRETYCQFVMTPQSGPVRSAYAGWGLLRNGSFEAYTIPNFSDSTNYIGDEILLFWLNQEIMKFPEERSNLLYLAVNLRMQMGDTLKAKELAIREVDYLLSKKQPNQEQLFNARNVVREVIKDNDLESKVNNAIQTHFPCNQDTRDQLIKEAFLESDFNKKEIMLDELLKQYPTALYKDTRTNTSDLYYSKLFQNVLYSKIVPGKDYSVLTKYFKDIPPMLFNTIYWHHVQLALRDGVTSPATLYELSSAFLGRLRRYYMEETELYKAPSQKEREFYSNNKHMLITHADLLLQTNRATQGLELADTLLPFYGYSSAEFNELYLRLLQANGKEGKIIPHIKQSLGENAASAQMVELLKVHYIKEHGSVEGFEAYLSSQKSDTEMLKFREKLLGTLIKEKIDLYAFEEMNGGRIDMSTLNGKIIVIDFWATWCAPCKAALPGMQMAVDSYSKDPDVCFFFLATQETKPSFKNDIREYMSKMGYMMTVIFDNPDSKGKPQDAYNQYSTKFGFSGIPHKMIIDGNGYLRWSSTGYHGSPTKLADEIGIIIEYLKKEAGKK